MDFYNFYVVVLIFGFCCRFSAVQGNHGHIRLSGGPNPSIGRVEVHDGVQWGTVCDDGWTDHNCALVCRDLLYATGRQITPQERLSMGSCEDLPILWDDVRCDASMTSVFDCERNPGPSNCNHDEDVHCVCEGVRQTTTTTTTTTTTAAPIDRRVQVPTCDTRRHKITPYDAHYPWIGRAEVTSQDGSTSYAICDDFWDDDDATVFCKCFEGTRFSSAGYRAFWKGSYSNMQPISIKYSAVHCTNQQAAGDKMNVFYCDVIEDSPGSAGTCDVMKEAAGVACGPIPTHLPTPPPIVTVECSTSYESRMKICFESSDSSYTLNPAYLELLPQCPDTSISRVPSASGFSKICVEVNMDTCVTSRTYADANNKTYCYDVRYSQYDRYPGVLMTDTVWNRRSCCQVLKNTTVTANFLASESDPKTFDEPEHRVIADAVNDLPFRFECYEDESFSGPPLVFPANVTRGQDLFCKVTVSTWDEHLYLVVPSCRFSATALGAPSYTFWADNCPQSQAMPVSYYNLGSHVWGIQFTVPLFQNYRSLYLTCGSYVCDRDLDAKPYCDRSCAAPSSAAGVPAAEAGRKRRAATPTVTHGNHRKTGGRSVATGEFTIQDTGFGPLILSNGTVIDIEADLVKYRVGSEVKHVQFRDLELLSQRGKAPGSDDVSKKGVNDVRDNHGDSVTSQRESPSLAPARRATSAYYLSVFLVLVKCVFNYLII